jgi:hypothetical protein
MFVYYRYKSKATKLTTLQILDRLIKPESRLKCSQKLTTDPYPKPHEYSLFM